MRTHFLAYRRHLFILSSQGGRARASFYKDINPIHEGLNLHDLITFQRPRLILLDWAVGFKIGILKDSNIYKPGIEEAKPTPLSHINGSVRYPIVCELSSGNTCPAPLDSVLGSMRCVTIAVKEHGLGVGLQTKCWCWHYPLEAVILFCSKLTKGKK